MVLKCVFVLEGEDVSTSSGFMVLKKSVFGRQDPSRNRKYSLTLRSVCGGVVRGLETNSAKKQANHSGVFPQCNLDSGWVESRNWVPNFILKAKQRKHDL